MNRVQALPDGSCHCHGVETQGSLYGAERRPGLNAYAWPGRSGPIKENFLSSGSLDTATSAPRRHAVSELPTKGNPFLWMRPVPRMNIRNRGQVYPREMGRLQAYEVKARSWC